MRCLIITWIRASLGHRAGLRSGSVPRSSVKNTVFQRCGMYVVELFERRALFSSTVREGVEMVPSTIHKREVETVSEASADQVSRCWRRRIFVPPLVGENCTLRLYHQWPSLPAPGICLIRKGWAISGMAVGFWR